MQLKGADGRKAFWKSSKPKVATVSQEGAVTIKGIGTTKITAKINGRKVMCIVSVSSRTAYRVVKKARKISADKKIQYSQPLRMNKNYYDCSSLVWRCYKPYGILFGAKTKNWAPTAAEEGRWCASSKRLVARQSIELLSCKLVPGDTIYYSYNGNNGRYLIIDHTAIFAGYAYDKWSGSYYGTVLEASSSNNTVMERTYYAGNSIMLIGRPSKQ